VAEDWPRRRNGGSRCRGLRVRILADYWATFTDGPGSVTGILMALSDDARGSIEQHVRAGYLLGLPDGPRSFPMMFRVVRGLVPA
jgi:hypothetical protein